MKMGRKTAAVILSVFLIAVQMAFTAAPVMAASYKKINSVSLHVRSKLEAGDSFSSDNLVIAEPDEGEVGVWTNSDKFFISSLKLVSGSSKDLKVGQEIKVRAVLEIYDEDAYRFKSGFSKKNVNISGNAECTELSRSNYKLTVTLKFNGVKGSYEEPDEAWWVDNDRSGLGQARWKSVSKGSGHYELQLKRGSTVIKHVADTTGTSYNFYPYMTKTGNYTFRVRVIPYTSSEKTYGKNSAWTDSDSIYISDREVSDGTGAIWDDNSSKSSSSGSQTAPDPTTGSSGAGWISTGGYWYYKYPDGQYKKSGWEIVQGKWYSFDDSGRMRTGWYQAPAGWYYLGADGAMLTGWQNINDSWYYLEEDPNSATYGRMAANALVHRDGKTWMVDENGHMVRGWKQIGDHWSYFYPGNGEMARDTWIDTFHVDANGVWRR